MTDDRRSARYAYEGLDRTIHEKARLGILTCLIGQPKGLAFSDLKTSCGLTDGNLARHLQVLEEAGLVRSGKRTEGRRAVTLCAITPAGRQRFIEYVEELERVVRDAGAAAVKNSEDADQQQAGGLSPRPI